MIKKQKLWFNVEKNTVLILLISLYDVCIKIDLLGFGF